MNVEFRQQHMRSTNEPFPYHRFAQTLDLHPEAAILHGCEPMANVLKHCGA